MKSIEIKATEQFGPVVLFMLYWIVLKLESVWNAVIALEFSNAEVLCGTFLWYCFYYAVRGSFNFWVYVDDILRATVTRHSTEGCWASLFSGAPNIKTLFRLSRVAFGSLEMHSKWRYKICICSVILGELESVRNYKGQCYFPENLRFSFYRKNSLT